jgi:arsenite oxidase small subunit
MRMNRRRFLKLLLTMTGLAALAPLLQYSQFFSYGSKPKIERKNIANISDLKPHSAMIFQWPTETYPYHTNILIRESEGSGGAGLNHDLFAYNRVCTHLQCLLNFDPGSDQFICPCHGSKFAAKTGDVANGPAQKALPIIELEEDENGDIYAVGVVGEFGYGR